MLVANNILHDLFLSTPSARRATSRQMTDCIVVEEFLSTPSARRATDAATAQVMRAVFLSTPSARRATDALRRDSKYENNFYPRPPRGGRRGGAVRAVGHLPISIHALREEGDLTLKPAIFIASIFLSTPSARRATKQREVICNAKGISIHALREEGDLISRAPMWLPPIFLSTPSARRATAAPQRVRWQGQFLSTPSARRATP